MNKKFHVKSSFKFLALILSILMMIPSVKAFANPTMLSSNEEASLKNIYEDYFLLGNVYATDYDYTNETRNSLLTKHFNAITLENSMKPQYISPAKGVYNFAEADRLVNAALERGMVVHGHTLCWHSQSARWLNNGDTGGTRALAKANLEDYIKNVCEHYRGRVISWDVVNEFFIDGIDQLPEGAYWRDYSRSSSQNAWRKAYGNGMNAEAGETDTDFLYDAFVFARKYDPDSKLYYNDFNLYQAGKADLVVQMVTELNSKYKEEYPDDPRMLIEGVGMQSHNYIQDTTASDIESSIQKFIALGVDISISELDLFCFFPWNGEPAGDYIDLRNRNSDLLIGANGTEEQKNYWSNRGVSTGVEVEKIQAKLFAEYFMVYKKYANHIERVTLWGLRDSDSWRRRHNPLLWNSDYSPKESLSAVIDPEGYLGEAAPNDLLLTSDKEGVISKGEYFNISISLKTLEQSNAASLTFTYDPTQFQYHAFTPTEGLTLLDLKNDNGIVTIVLGNLDGYHMDSLGTALFSANETISEDNSGAITARLDYVTSNNNQKDVHVVVGSLSFWTVTVPGDTDGDGKITLIDLSNVIDYFGVSSNDEQWKKAKFYDFNHNGKIDIYDVSVVAARIQ